MHLYVIARAQADRLKRWENDILARYYPFKYHKDKPDGKVQLALRPIQLYEIVFPEEHLDKVVSAIQPYGGFNFNTGWTMKLRKLLTKVLHLEPIPKVEKGKDDQNQAIYNDYVDVAGIGIKKDKYIDGIEQL